MIAEAKPVSRRESTPAWHEPFLAMLPTIIRHAAISFTDQPYQARKELVQEAVAIAQKESGPDPFQDDWLAYSNPALQNR